MTAAFTNKRVVRNVALDFWEKLVNSALFLCFYGGLRHHLIPLSAPARIKNARLKAPRVLRSILRCLDPRLRGDDGYYFQLPAASLA
jgi:hypothetical protein